MTMHNPTHKPFQVSCRNKDYYAHFETLEKAQNDLEYEFKKTGSRERYIIENLDTRQIVDDSILRRSRNSFPLLAGPDAHWTDRVVTEGHAGACKIWGHADYRVDGVLQSRCPRCGEVKCHAEHAFDCGV